MVQSSGSIEEASFAGSPSSLGWPFGLPTCMVIHTPSPDAFAESTPLAFHQQFMNFQTSFLLPFFSDADGGSSSASDTDSLSEAASSFFKDSRRITLGRLIGLPIDTSLGAMHPDAHFHVFSARNRGFLPSCGILEFLGCGRNSSAMAHDLETSDDEAAVTASSASLAACLHLERSASQGTDPSDTASMSVAFEDALSIDSRSPDWNDQFVSCHSILSGGEWTDSGAGVHGGEQTATPMSIPMKSTPRQYKSLNTQKMQRSLSLKSFFSSICCRTDAEKP